MVSVSTQAAIDGALARRDAARASALPWRRMLAATAMLALAVWGALSVLGAGVGRTPLLSTTRSGPVSERGVRALPRSARGPISAALAAGQRSYRVTSARDGLWASNRVQHLAARFTRAGVELSSGALRTALSANALGYGRSLHALPAGLPRARANRVEYARGGVREWYANGPFGLEQGFTIASAGDRAAGALTLAITLTGNARVSLDRRAQSLSLHGRGGTFLRYGGLLVTDARGQRLPSWLELRGRELLLRADTRGARFPVRIDPFIQQGAKLSSAEASTNGELGMSVALSADGNTALVGSPGDGSGVGAAWVFTRSGETWTQQGPKLTGGEESGNARFGFRVALSADGNTALVGGPVDGSGVGAAWVFTRSGETWTQQGPKLTGGEESGKGEFGVGVALSGDGTTALVGGSGDSAGAGAAWVFTRSESTWAQQGGKLTGAGEVGAGRFGFSVALSEDGNSALIGGGSDNSGVGAAWAFTRSEAAWAQQGSKLTGEGEAGAGHFGFSVALSANASTALIGGVADNGELGAAWVFTRSESTWAQQGPKLTGAGESGFGLFGYSGALSANGSMALVGGPGDASRTGAAWVFARSGSSWEQQGSKLTGQGEVGKGEFGASSALSAEGSTALVGGPADEGKGAAWAFLNAPLTPTVVTGEASTITGSSATLNATVNPNGQTVTDCHFEYGTSTEYGSSAPCSSPPGSGETPVSVIASVSGLAATTTYHFRIVATNASGTSVGADKSFTTSVMSEPVFVSKATIGEVVATHIPITGTLGSALLETKSGTKISCSGGTFTGELTGPKSSAKNISKFTGCESGGQPCGNTGEREITTRALAAELQNISSTVPGERLGNETVEGAVERHGIVAEFTCASVLQVVVQGTVIGNLSGAAGKTSEAAQTGKLLTTIKLSFSQSAGVQKYCKFSEGTAEEKECEQLESSIGGGSFEAVGESVIATIKTVPSTWGLGVTK